YRQLLACEEANQRIRGSAVAGCAGRNGVQHRLQLGGGAGDRPQDLADGGLLLEGFLQLIEQVDILEGAPPLPGEGLYEFDLGLREWVRLPSAEREVAHVLPLAG